MGDTGKKRSEWGWWEEKWSIFFRQRESGSNFFFLPLKLAKMIQVELWKRRSASQVEILYLRVGLEWHKEEWGDERWSVGKGGQTITLKQIIGQHWLYNGAVRGLPYRYTMVCVHTCAYVHMLSIRGGMSGSLCASGDWVDVCEDRRRGEGKH